ncbi:NAD(P)/FAD-dependent oxidoreductase [Catenulispora pinisilvae]|uniref:NAD(P)/FAD-dependent oxidoreductase n=1 Tax=Catenulispora pinisilvae TaxID=2705253 RepID=UPI002B26D094|nr:FAD-binding oxidoreductase [Catenulispora pinisilvae]
MPLLVTAPVPRSGLFGVRGRGGVVSVPAWSDEKCLPHAERRTVGSRDVFNPLASKDLVVVGAGIVGASVAYHAARAGAAVTLVDAGRPGSGVTADSFAWIGASGVRTGPAAGLRVTATEEYRRLEAELPGLPVSWSGSLSWSREDSAPDAGPGERIVDAATVARLEPAVRRPPEWAVWAPDDGAVDSVGVSGRLVAGARSHGARVHLDTSVVAVRRDAAGRVAGVETTAGFLSGATVVLAAGVATAALGASLGVRVPVEPSPCPLFRFRGPAGLVRTVVNTEDFDLRQVGADRLIAAADSPERILGAVRSTFRGTESVELLSTRIGARPMPADGEPIVGPVAEVPGLYLAVMHSAVTLAAAVGRLVAREVVDGSVESVLSGCRLDRF